MRVFLTRLRANWMRNTLAVIQVAISIAAVTAVLATIVPAFRPEKVIDESDAVLEVRFGMRTTHGWSSRGVFTPEDAQVLTEQADTIEMAGIESREYMPLIRVGEQRYLLQFVSQVSPGYERIVDMDMVAGSFFLDHDMERSDTPGVVISDKLAVMLFGRTNAVGELINLRPDGESNKFRGFATVGGMQDTVAWESMPGQDVNVIGVFKASTDTGGTFGRFDPHMYVPLGVMDDLRRTASFTTLEERTTQIAAPVMFVRRYGELLVKPYPGQHEAAMTDIRAILEPRLRARGEYDAVMNVTPMDLMIEPQQHMESFQRTSALQGAALVAAMALAALVVSGFAIFTTTMANLTQRSRHIGLSRSIGATRGRVVREVVLESALLSGMGGLAGALAAYPLGRYVLGQLMGTSAAAGDLVIAGIIGIALAVIIGAAAALYPGWTVARLMPAEAWREGQA